MNDGLQQALATFLGTVGTALLVVITYFFGPGGYLRHKWEEDEEEEHRHGKEDSTSGSDTE